jgi:hypothetical protein
MKCGQSSIIVTDLQSFTSDAAACFHPFALAQGQTMMFLLDCLIASVNHLFCRASQMMKALGYHVYNATPVSIEFAASKRCIFSRKEVFATKALCDGLWLFTG